jgi:glycosyltransferase involved in cell wall biosynthesis
MSSIQEVGPYVIVSPVKDEDPYIETTIRSVINQRVRPIVWLIVDDGSRDRTAEIVKNYCKRYSWIQLLTIDRDAVKRVGRAEVIAFANGYQQITCEHEFVVKLDGDVDLPENYFSDLIARFHEDAQLGIASGLFCENRNGTWTLRPMPEYHAVGATKMLRVECYKQIGGFPLEPGWDTVDEIRARARGWKTRHFPDLIFWHLKPEGSSSGYIHRSNMCGEIDYRTGLSLPFFTLKAIHRTIVDFPPVLSGISLFVGYVRALVGRRPKLVTVREQDLYRQLLNSRLLRVLSKPQHVLRGKVWASN